MTSFNNLVRSTGIFVTSSSASILTHNRQECFVLKENEAIQRNFYMIIYSFRSLFLFPLIKFEGLYAEEFSKLKISLKDIPYSYIFLQGIFFK